MDQNVATLTAVVGTTAGICSGALAALYLTTIGMSVGAAAGAVAGTALAVGVLLSVRPFLTLHRSADATDEKGAAQR